MSSYAMPASSYETYYLTTAARGKVEVMHCGHPTNGFVGLARVADFLSGRHGKRTSDMFGMIRGMGDAVYVHDVGAKCERSLPLANPLYIL